MDRAYLSETVAAGLSVLVVSGGVPIALAEVPGYLFQDFDQRSSITASDTAAITTTNAQIAAATRKADRAVATGQQALWEAQQTTRNAPGDMPASLLPAQPGGRKN